MVGADSKAHEQIEVAGRQTVGGGGADDLSELVERVEAESPHPMLEICLGNRLLGLHRMHETQGGLRQRLGDQPYFAKRRDVVMRNARIPQDLQQLRRGIGLHRIERLARKLLDEESGSAPGGARTKEGDRFKGTLTSDVGNGAF